MFAGARTYHQAHVADGLCPPVAGNRRFRHRADRARDDNPEVGDRLSRVDDPVRGHRVYRRAGRHLALVLHGRSMAPGGPRPGRGMGGGGNRSTCAGRWPSPFLACVDSAVYVALALGAQACVPPAVRDNAFSWLVISMSGQLIVPAWYAPGGARGAAGARLRRWPTGPARCCSRYAVPGRWRERRSCCSSSGSCTAAAGGQLYGRAAAADADLDRADRAAREQYAILCQEHRTPRA